MNRCTTCKNNRRQLLMLKCNHDVCVKCAADNYFINCKNKINNKKSRNSNYFCQKCLQQTELDANTIDELKKYFMDNVSTDEKHKAGRRDRILQRQNHQKERYEKINRLDVQSSSRPKSLQIEIAQRKRTLSKYLNEKQVQKFIEMQNQYGSRKKKFDNEPPERGQNNVQSSQKPTGKSNSKLYNNEKKSTRQPYQIQGTFNEYQLKKNQYQLLKKKEAQNSQVSQRQRRVINDSFQNFAVQQKYHNDYMRVGQHLAAAKIKNTQRYSTQNNQDSNSKLNQDMEYELYHNGKAVPSYNPQTANYLLQEERLSKGNTQGSNRHSSHSSNKAVGTIKSKRSPNARESITQCGPNGPISPVVGKQQRKPPGQGSITRTQRLASCKSQDNLQNVNFMPNSNVIKGVSVQYNMRAIESSTDMWQVESKSTKKYQQEITVPHMNRNNSQTVQKILQNFQITQEKAEPLQKIKQKSTNAQKSKSRLSPNRQKIQIYFCKIHQDEQIMYFCLRCNQLICSQCALHGSHKAHQIHSLKKSALHLRQSLAHKVNLLTKMLIQEESKQKILKECLNEISLQCNKQKQKIRSSFQNFIFHVDKKYKQLLKDIEDKFTTVMTEYGQKLIQSRNSYITIGRIKDNVCDTLQQFNCYEEGTVSQTSIGAACNQFGNFNIKRPKNKMNVSPFVGGTGIDYINKLTSRIRQLQEFLKTSNALLFSGKKESLISDHSSSLKLSESSNLLDDDFQKDLHQTPSTNTIPPRSNPTITPTKIDKKNKKIVVSSYSLNVRSRVKLSQCEPIVESLIQMQQIVKSIQLQSIQYELKALL